MAQQGTRGGSGLEEVWLILFLLLGTVVLWSTVVQQTTFGQIYQIIFFFTLIIFILSKVTPKFAEFQNLNSKGITIQILAGFILGFALVATLFGASFAFLSPLSVPDIRFTMPIGILGFELLSSLFMMSILVAEIEESFRTSALRPTIAEWVANRHARTIFLLVTGVIIYMVIPPLRFLGAILFVFAAIDGILKFKFVDRLFRSPATRNFLAILVAGSFFAVLHLRAYGGTEGLELAVTAALIMNAFLFAVIADIVNWKFKSATASKIAHCLNNATISAVAVGLPALTGAFVTLIYAVILFFMSRGTLQDLHPANILKSVGGVQ